MPTQVTDSQLPSFHPDPVQADRGGHAFGTTQEAETELNLVPLGGFIITAPDQLELVALAEASPLVVAAAG